jgi:hypothetical protein
MSEYRSAAKVARPTGIGALASVRPSRGHR